MRGSWAWLAALALLVGLATGIADVVFHLLTRWFTQLFSGGTGTIPAGEGINSFVPWLGRYFLLFAPVIGGLLYGFITWRFGPGVRGSGVPEVMYAVSRDECRIPPRIALVKPLASALCIGSGGSLGREGPAVQTGAALGALAGRRFGISGERLRLLAACGAAGGISALLNTPIAGVIFSLELILRDFEAESFGAVVLSSVTAAVIGRGLIGEGIFFDFPEFSISSPVEYLFYAGLGVLAAGISVAFIRVRFGAEDAADRLWRGPEWARPAVGGVLLGAILFLLPEMYGSGYGVLENAVHGEYVFGFLLLLLVGKMVATSVTFGIGGSGGVFGPLLFMGAMLGSAYGGVAERFLPGLTGTPGTYGLVGMAAMFAGAAQAPFTAVITVFELTGEYSLILPLMAAVAVSTVISRLLTLDTVYLLKLHGRGIYLDSFRQEGWMQRITVRDAMYPAPEPVASEASLEKLAARFADEQVLALPVTDPGGALRGTVSSVEVEKALANGEHSVTALGLTRTAATLDPGQTLDEALGKLVRRASGGLPVVNPEDGEIVGWLSNRDVLRAYSDFGERDRADEGI
jgi:CIC family chloride channel protein